MPTKKPSRKDRPGQESARIEEAFQHVTTMVKPKNVKMARLWFEIGWHQSASARALRAATRKKGKS